MDLIKFGPNIKYCSFSDQVEFMSYSILRAFILHNPDARSKLMNDKEKDGEDGSRIKSIIDRMIDSIKPDQC